MYFFTWGLNHENLGVVVKTQSAKKHLQCKRTVQKSTVEKLHQCKTALWKTRTSAKKHKLKYAQCILALVR